MGQVHKDSGKFGIALAVFVGASALAATSVRAADSVTYVESVDCVAGVCEARHKTEPLVRTMRERHPGGMCTEFTRRIAGLKKVPTIDPNRSIELPQYQDSQTRYVRCDQNGASGRLVSAAASTR